MARTFVINRSLKESPSMFVVCGDLDLPELLTKITGRFLKQRVLNNSCKPSGYDLQVVALVLLEHQKALMN